MNKYQVGYYKDGEEWIKTVSAASEEEAIEQVKNEIPDAEIKDVNQTFEVYQFGEPDENRDRIDLTTDRFEPKARWNEWGEFTDSGRELQRSLWNVLTDKELYPDDITVKEKDGVTKVYIDIGGDWKHEHGYLRHVMTDELGYMEINQEELTDDFYSEGGDSYKARHTFIMFPDLMKFNEMRGIKNSRQIKSSKHILKSGYYNDPVNHTDGGGTCDYCGTEIAPGDGYEADFDSTWCEARTWLYMALVDDPNAKPYYAPEDDWRFASWLGGDWTDDDVHDVLEEIIDMAYEGGEYPHYMCSDCLTKRLKEAAEKWVEENW